MPRWLWLAFGQNKPLDLLAICVPLGLALFFWSQRSLAQYWTGEIKTPATIVSHGPYKYLRHPMYVSYLLMQLGHASYSPLLPLLASIPYYLYRIKKENKLL